MKRARCGKSSVWKRGEHQVQVARDSYGIYRLHAVDVEFSVLSHRVRRLVSCCRLLVYVRHLSVKTLTSQIQVKAVVK